MMNCWSKLLGLLLAHRLLNKVHQNQKLVHALTKEHPSVLVLWWSWYEHRLAWWRCMNRCLSPQRAVVLVRWRSLYEHRLAWWRCMNRCLSPQKANWRHPARCVTWRYSVTVTVCGHKPRWPGRDTTVWLSQCVVTSLADLDVTLQCDCHSVWSQASLTWTWHYSVTVTVCGHKPRWPGRQSPLSVHPTHKVSEGNDLTVNACTPWNLLTPFTYCPAGCVAIWVLLPRGVNCHKWLCHMSIAIEDHVEQFIQWDIYLMGLWPRQTTGKLHYERVGLATWDYDLWLLQLYYCHLGSLSCWTNARRNYWLL